LLGIVSAAPELRIDLLLKATSTADSLQQQVDPIMN